MLCALFCGENAYLLCKRCEQYGGFPG